MDKLETAINASKLRGSRVAIDGNYRPRGWGNSDVGRNRARTTFERFFRLADIALPTLDDEQALWGDVTAEAVLARLASWGIGEITLKRGADGALLRCDGHTLNVPIEFPVTPVDTTAAGDSFNAAYLAARLRGAKPAAAARSGHLLAGTKIHYRGAIMPREAMPQGLA